MKTYGKDRFAYANRHIKGTSRDCPCCVPHSAKGKNPTKVYKKRARQAGKKEASVQGA